MDLNQNEKLSQNKIYGLGLDPLAILNLFRRYWYYFLFSLIISIVGIRFYMSHTLPTFRTSSTILVNETENRSLVDNTALLEGLGLPGGMKNIENQMMIIKSRALTESTLRELSFDIEYYFKTLRNRLPIYPETPIKVVCDDISILPKDVEFSIEFLGDNMFTIKSEYKYFPFQKTASFGDTIAINNGVLSIENRNEDWLTMNMDRKLYFVIHSRNALVNYFSSRLNVELISRGGSIMRISLVGTNRERDVDFLNKHIEKFQSVSVDKKNQEANRRIQFIDEQLIGISDSLLLTENELQQFRSSRKVMNISAQGQEIISQVTALENERARLNLEANYYDYLSDYLAKEISGETPIIPISMGISDPALTRLVDELAELQRQLTSTGAGEMNPLQRNLEQRVRNTKGTLMETLNGLRRANSLARSENQEQINRINLQAAALPATERQLLGIERKFRINDELYTFLLQTRAEQQMQKASNRADSEVVDPADVRFSSLVSPNKTKVYFIGIFLGVSIPFLIFFLSLIFNNKLTEEDLRKINYLPIAGNIPHNSDKGNTVVIDNPNSAIAEAFRLLRTRMQFLTKEASSPVILVTSAMPEDGKTYTAINLASVYSLLGKKTILLGFDLRKPKLQKEFGLSNEKGISTWLIGKDDLPDIIQDTKLENLSVIAAGPVPPNPSELTALEKTSDLLSKLRITYDYIIIDSSPLGIVSDAFHIASLADASLLVVRPSRTFRTIFEKTLNEIIGSGIKGFSMVINDIQANSRHYGYGEKYGYTDEKRSRTKRTEKLKR